MTITATDRLAHEVLLPATAASELTPTLRRLLERGCRGVLLGETRAEYLARRIARPRAARETASLIGRLIGAVAALVDGPAIVAVDHEVGGIQRLRHLVTPLPTAAEAAALSSDELIELARRSGQELGALGVTLTLGPIVDVVRGPNPWLERRHLGPDTDVVSRVGAAVVSGLQAGGVSATAKHFPGNAAVPADPAAEPATVGTSRKELYERDLPPFRAVIAAGVRAVMLGPATVAAVDPARPASLSEPVVRLLRDELGFGGTIITDDLDARSILSNGDLGATAVAALKAGADLLLVAEDGGASCAIAISEAVKTGVLSAGRLGEAAASVRRLASATSRQARPTTRA